jgi:cytochrome c553
MRISVRALIVVAAVVFAATTVAGQKVNPKANVKAVGFPPPYWAYPANAPDYQAPPDDGVPRTVPNSNVKLTLTTIREVTTPPDWHPEDHPAMPPVVGNAPKSQVWACGYCHLPVGWGKPENANVANLPEAYFMQQVADYKSGKRRSSIPDIVPHSGMLEAVTNTSDAEIHKAWEYFSKNKLTTQAHHRDAGQSGAGVAARLAPDVRHLRATGQPEAR